jgi:hypothetical protein
MPRYPMTAYFNEQEIGQINQTCTDKGLLKNSKPNHYAFMRLAAMAFCEACKKEKKHDDRKPDSEGKSPGEGSQTSGKTDSNDRSTEQQAGRADLTLPEATNHFDPDDIGL